MRRVLVTTNALFLLGAYFDMNYITTILKKDIQVSTKRVHFHEVNYHYLIERLF